MEYKIYILVISLVLLNSKTYSTNVNCNSVVSEINSIYNIPINYIFNTDTAGVPIQEQVTFYGISTGQTEFTIINKNNFGTVFNLAYNTIFLIHGWIDSVNGSLIIPNSKWMQDAATALITNGNINVICVDWSPLAYYDYLVAATNHTKLVGNYVASFIQDISDAYGIPLNSIIIVGHSLGGQTAGYVGANLNGQIGFILGLDPAGPCFTIPFDEGIENRLDPTDAIFVQVLHTACGSLGAQIDSGDSDFYANGGASQPGCILSGATIINPTVIYCSHLRAAQMFVSSIVSTHKFLGYQCLLSHASCNVILSAGSIIPLIGTILQPKIQCFGTSDTFGLYSAKRPGAYQLLTTNENYPYL